MMKKVLFALVATALFLSAENDTVTFELKGDFGKELKALIEKYKDSGQITVVEKKVVTDDKTIGEQIKSFFVEKEKKESEKKKIDLFALGKKLYTTKCHACHGERAEKKAYNRSRPLISLSLEDMEESIRGYKVDQYDRGNAFIMKPFADSLNDEELQGVYEYIKSLNN
jgi:mono/diheme cytochrome c family protein